MEIKQSELSIEFWFETEVNDELLYRTWLDYSNMIWLTKSVHNPVKVIISGIIEGDSTVNIEEERVRELLTKHIKNT